MTSAPADQSPSHSSGAATSGCVLVLNSGSSSLKFAVVDPATGDRALSGIVERLGTAKATLSITRGGSEAASPDLRGDDHAAAVAAIVDLVQSLSADHQPGAVGHRVVHGGEQFAASVVINDDVIDAIATFSPLAPLHNPAALLGIRAAMSQWPSLSHVAVFDTSFHQTMPPHAYRYAVPEEWYALHGVRRYGFHGTSHRYVSGKAAEILGRPIADLAMVVAHLGNGCSATAVLGGRSVDTTMGLTPLEGLVMGTRSGDIDPAVFGFLEAESEMTIGQVTDALNQQSGLLGLSGRTNDVRELTAAAAGGDERAALALDVFVYRLSKAIAALVVGLGRLDALAFTGGIGENSALIRRRVVESLPFLGVRIDDQANDRHGGDSDGHIGRGGPAVLVVATDEELMIALDTSRLAS
jgi:acetate kinase